uniref:Uncharacterized protein n=1 Tax=Rhizophora mucronata TaxID=61149 RepID=A0A2P2R427_RHIMU
MKESACRNLHLLLIWMVCNLCRPFNGILCYSNE